MALESGVRPRFCGAPRIFWSNAANLPHHTVKIGTVHNVTRKAYVHARVPQILGQGRVPYWKAECSTDRKFTARYVQLDDGTAGRHEDLVCKGCAFNCDQAPHTVPRHVFRVREGR